MSEKIQKLREILAEIFDLERASALLGWDQQTYMPSAGALMRGYQSGTIDRMAHDMATSAALGKLLDDLRPTAGSLDPDSDDARLVRVAALDFERAKCVPSDYVEELARVAAQAFPAWAQARQSSRFSVFQPYLEKLVEMTHRYVSFFPPAAHPYDVLLDRFEPGLTTAEVQAIFKPLREKQVALIKWIATAPQVDDSCLHQKFDTQAQWDFGVHIITKIGFDWNRGRQDKSAHPFTMGLSADDVRITTRMNPDYFGDSLFSTMHECGHALYEQGFAEGLGRSPLGNAASLAVHESQSRMWENLVGRSLSFWRYAYPALVTSFPQLKGVPLTTFYKAINRVQPSLIRTEADEATYNLHVMLRMEIEIALLEGTLAVKDLPEAWNSRMKDYLGVTPPDDAHGVLQDVHWAYGELGYFPTYALGNLISAQLWETIRAQIPDIEAQIEAGKFDALLGWLREKIHRHGRKFAPQEMVRRVTGSGIDAAPYLRYLETKYRAIYEG